MGALLSKKKKSASSTAVVSGGWQLQHPEKNGDIKVVMLGSGGVGKSCFTIQFVQNRWVEEYDPTIEDNFRKQTDVDGETALFDVLDTAGQEEWKAMRDQWIRFGDGFLLMYSITNSSTFDEITRLHEHILRAKDAAKGPIVLVGNKCDLESQRQVTTAQAKAFADKLGIPFFEASAKTKVNVDEAFAAVCRSIRQYRGGGKK
jgi:GTPase KRas protein